MTREFGFTEEQMANIVRQSVILAQITGKDLTEAVRGVTYAIGSGYFESLQRAGINISRQIIAEEALARGYEGSYTALSQNIRAMITYEIVQKNLSSIQQDAGAIVEVGSYHGRSTVALSCGAEAGAKLPVYAIEPHEHFIGELGGNFGPPDRAAFFETMLRTSCFENVRLVNLSSEIVSPGWQLPVSALWIDGTAS